MEFCMVFLFHAFSKAEGAFKKLKPEPNSGISSVSGSISSPGSGISTLPTHTGHSGHTPASCPTPARRRHRTTFTQVRYMQAFKAVLFINTKFT